MIGITIMIMIMVSRVTSRGSLQVSIVLWTASAGSPISLRGHHRHHHHHHHHHHYRHHHHQYHHNHHSHLGRVTLVSSSAMG